MSMLNEIRAKMNEALKAGDKETKQVYSSILNALTGKAKALLVQELTPEQETEVIQKLVKQNKESIDTCPADRTDILRQLQFERDILVRYMPKQMDADEIRAVIGQVLIELNITAPTAKDKGRIMKNLMPLVKGKADGKMVNDILAAMSQ
ncbi:MAG: GatB/YqeY domain-containing protein [Clostridia bacterium]|nr:GatB/YqeY domain-containing protein [Clostridia bacterium]